MEILHLLESIRFPAMDEAMLLITQLGEETAFLVTALIVFWCVDKRKGYFLMSVGFLGTMLNQFLKLLFAIPRPWVLNPELTIVEAAREAAAGYSFPSGHSQNAVGTFGGLAAVTENKWVRRLCVAAAVLVPFSRMYLGVHTPQDVLVGSGMALLLVFVLRPLTVAGKELPMKATIAIMLTVAVGLLMYVEMHSFPVDMDPHNLASGQKNAYTMLGCLIGVAIVYVAEKKYVQFETKAIWWAQILKAALGLGCVLLVKEGLRSPLEMLLPVYPARAVRYFLVVITAGLLWPMSFRWFSKLGEKK